MPDSPAEDTGDATAASIRMRIEVSRIHSFRVILTSPENVHGAHVLQLLDTKRGDSHVAAMHPEPAKYFSAEMAGATSDDTT